ncbi:pesticin C-terminus-like muramidase [Cronobacter dublinensis]
MKELGNDEMDLKWLTVPFGQLTFDSEGSDIEDSLYFSRHPHVPNNKSTVIGSSGVTFGRGLDLGQQTTTYLEGLLQEMEKHSQPLSVSLKGWLPGGVGKQGVEALTYCNV